MLTLLKVALNMNALPIHQKIKKARRVSKAMAKNAAVFTNTSLLAGLNAAVKDLEAALTNAPDEEEDKTVMKHDKEQELMGHMRQLAAYVEQIAGDEADIVRLAGLDVKHSDTNKPGPEFEVQGGHGPGNVRLRTRARHRVFYRWQHSSDPEGRSGWTTILTSHVCSVVVRNIQPGNHWFRVVLVDAAGEHPLPGLRLLLND